MTNKERLAKLDGVQLDTMWNFLKLRKQCECTKQDVQLLREHCENIRIALTQKNAGQRKDGAKDCIDFDELGTYINFVVIDALVLYIYGGLDKLEEVLPDEK